MTCDLDVNLQGFFFNPGVRLTYFCVADDDFAVGVVFLDIKEFCQRHRAVPAHSLSHEHQRLCVQCRALQL